MNPLENIDLKYRRRAAHPFSWKHWISNHLTVAKQHVWKKPLQGPNNFTYSKGLITTRFGDTELYFKFNPIFISRETVSWITDEFTNEPYKQLDVKNRTVLDVGCANGTTAIYFMLKGAKEIYCYDIDRKAASEAQSNASLNGFGTQIHVNAQMCDLDDFVSHHDSKNMVMKIDCEGGEYPLFDNASDESILAFDEIIGEYHRGYLNLKQRLERLGYMFSFTEPSIVSRTWPPKTAIGIFFAKKIGQDR